MIKEVHPICDAFPDHTEHELNALSDSLKEIGQTTRITYWRPDEETDPVLVDGRHRKELIPKVIADAPVCELYTCHESWIVEWIFAQNFSRRMMTDSQKALLMIAKEQFFKGAKLGRPRADAKEQSISAQCRTQGITRSTYYRVKGIKQKGVPELSALLQTHEDVPISHLERAVEVLNDQGQLEFVRHITDAGEESKDAIAIALQNKTNRRRTSGPEMTKKKVSLTMTFEEDVLIGTLGANYKGAVKAELNRMLNKLTINGRLVFKKAAMTPEDE